MTRSPRSSDLATRGADLDRLAETGEKKAIKFPRPLLDRDSLDFSFSGLKTAVLYHVRGVPARGINVKNSPMSPPTGQELSDIAAGFQAACIDVIVEKIRRAARRIDARSVILGGGVSANRGLRAAMEDFELPVFFRSGDTAPTMPRCPRALRMFIFSASNSATSIWMRSLIVSFVHERMTHNGNVTQLLRSRPDQWKGIKACSGAC